MEVCRAFVAACQLALLTVLPKGLPDTAKARETTGPEAVQCRRNGTTGNCRALAVACLLIRRRQYAAALKR
jgi:hypothetical protein